MRIRTGRRNGHTLYLQTSEHPGDADAPLGFCVSPAAAQELADLANDGLGYRLEHGMPAEPHYFGLPARVRE